MNEPIYVTESSLPPLKDFLPYLEKIWFSKTLTNGGPFHQMLERELMEFLGVKEVSLFNNGTNALMTAIQSLDLTGEVITTPYSFVATTHALIWNNLTPIFVDIDPRTFNIDPAKIEEAITDKTTAILAVHCYGNPCDVEAIEKIAKKHNLKVIYDAAHAFGVKYKGQSILNYGDISILSFHATKVFNTFEGGAVISQYPEIKKKIDRLKNFGIQSEVEVIDFGSNGKIAEPNCAFGLVQLKYIKENIIKRKNIAEKYYDSLGNIEALRLFKFNENIDANYSYFPVVVEENRSVSRDDLYNVLKENNIFSRRYFFPLISDFEIYKKANYKSFNTYNAQKISRNVLCLPMFSEMSDDQFERITSEIVKVLK